ncbi:hypothetical protein FQR65_LT18002 [Abscondita terminalis]|nr:hypothetical protein FQR65_LT18002 [Abscondita terminalis]
MSETETRRAPPKLYGDGYCRGDVCEDVSWLALRVCKALNKYLLTSYRIPTRRDKLRSAGIWLIECFNNWCYQSRTSILLPGRSLAGPRCGINGSYPIDVSTPPLRRRSGSSVEDTSSSIDAYKTILVSP